MICKPLFQLLNGLLVPFDRARQYARDSAFSGPSHVLFQISNLSFGALQRLFGARRDDATLDSLKDIDSYPFGRTQFSLERYGPIGGVVCLNDLSDSTLKFLQMSGFKQRCLDTTQKTFLDNMSRDRDAVATYFRSARLV